jgi:hypothetical protein
VAVFNWNLKLIQMSLNISDHPPLTVQAQYVAATQSAVNEGHPGMASAVGDIDGTVCLPHLSTINSDFFFQLNWSGFDLSPELPRLPPPPPFSPPSIEPGKLSADAPAAESGNTVAAQDIDLELNERNIIPRKRKRTVSTRAAASVVSSWPSKKYCLLGELVSTLYTSN